MNENRIPEVYDNNISDARIWSMLGNGDIRALKTLFHRHKDYLYQYSLKLSGQHALAEDCVHELFFRIWDGKENLSEVTSVKSYLWISIRRDVIRAVNSGKKEILTDNISTLIPGFHFSPEEIIIHSERKSASRTRLVKALNQLPARQREAIFLKYFHGMSYDEMEQIMSVNYQTARNYISDGVRTLKMYMDEQADSLSPYTVMIS
ncbi:MAG: RNA polymerase sigma factor [Balneolaceae bacterium]